MADDLFGDLTSRFGPGDFDVSGFVRGAAHHLERSLAQPASLRYLPARAALETEMIAPGAVAVPTLEEAKLILDPHIQLVLVTRPQWVAREGAEIERGFQQIVDLMQSGFGPHYYWKPHSQEISLREGLRGNFPVGSFHSDFDRFWELFIGDSARLRESLQTITGAEAIVSRCRYYSAPASLPEHTDSQCITYSCTYLGGAPVARLLNGRLLTPRRGEVAIWKGEMYNDPVYHPGDGSLLQDGDESAINPGQALPHYAPTDPRVFPRYTMIHDVEDLLIPERVLPALIPWK